MQFPQGPPLFIISTQCLLLPSASSIGDNDQVVLTCQLDTAASFCCRVPVSIGDNDQVVLTCQLDTAASCNVMSIRNYRKLGSPPKMESKTSLYMYDGSTRESLGRCGIQVMNREGQLSELEFEILDTKHHTLLSLDTCLNLQLLSYDAECVCMTEVVQRFTESIVQDTRMSSVERGVLRGSMTL